MTPRTFGHVIGIDDAPFDRKGRTHVLIVGTAFARTRLEGVLSSHIERDGDDATWVVASMVKSSRFYEHTRAIMLQGITLGGFNVVNLRELSGALDLPVLVVARRKPNLESIKAALLPLPNGQAKWSLIEEAGPMEPLEKVFVQRVGLDRDEAQHLLQSFALVGVLPEPLRVAHLIAGGIATGQSRGRA